MNFKSILVLAVISSAILSGTAYASINGNEAELLAIINSTREYNGVLYQVEPSYREAARNYLDDPEIDCTDEQKQKAIDQMFGSIQQGIDEGYLIAVGGGTASGDTSGSSSDVKGEITAQAAGMPQGGGTSDTGGAQAPLAEGAAASEHAENAADGIPANRGAGDAETETSEAETAPPETEPSPIVLALEQAMNAPQETSSAMAAGSLLPEIIYPTRFVGIFAIGALIAAVAAAAGSFYLGLFRHHHKKKSGSAAD